MAQTSNGRERDDSRHIESLARAYTPEQIERLAAAYEGALATLNIAGRMDLAKHAIARKVLELAERDRDYTPALIYTRALTELGLPEVRYYRPAGI